MFMSGNDNLHKLQLLNGGDKFQSNPIQQPKLYVESEVPTIGSHTFSQNGTC